MSIILSYVMGFGKKLEKFSTPVMKSIEARTENARKMAGSMFVQGVKLLAQCQLHGRDFEVRPACVLSLQAVDIFVVLHEFFPKLNTGDEKGDFFIVYQKEADEFDREFSKKYDEDLNTTLIFVRTLSLTSAPTHLAVGGSFLGGHNCFCPRHPDQHSTRLHPRDCRPSPYSDPQGRQLHFRWRRYFRCRLDRPRSCDCDGSDSALRKSRCFSVGRVFRSPGETVAQSVHE